MNAPLVIVLCLGILAAACRSAEGVEDSESFDAGTEAADAAAAASDAAAAAADAGYGFCTDMHRVVCDAACDWDERFRACTYQPGALTAYACFVELTTGDLWVSPYSAPFDNIRERFRPCRESEYELAMDSSRVYPD